MAEDSSLSSSSSSEASPPSRRRRSLSRGRRHKKPIVSSNAIADKENQDSNRRTKSKSKSRNQIRSRRRSRSRRQTPSRSRDKNGNRIYDFDDISSLHCDEYGYDRRPKDEDSSDGESTTEDDESVEGFFQAPTKEELSNELFRLVDAGTKPSDALNSLQKLRQWGIVADNDPTTMKYLVEFQALPTLFYFVRASLDKRRSLKKKLVEKLYTLQGNSNKERGTEFRKHQQAYVKASTDNERGLQAAMQVIRHYTCFSNTTTTTTTTKSKSKRDKKNDKKKSLKSLVLKKAILAQLVDIDGVDMLVNLLEEQLQDLMGPKNESTNNAHSPAFAEYGHSICRSIWLILMNVGACDHAIQLLKDTPSSRHNDPHHHYSKARRLVKGISMGLDHRFKVASNVDRIILHIMPQWALSSGIDCYNRNMDLLEPYRSKRNHKKKSSSSSWMEDLFLALCRLVASKDTEHLDRPHDSSQHLKSNQHDEARTLVIDLCLVSKCLKALLDEPNTVVGQDPFITTLALTFFYVCLRFGTQRYKLLQRLQHRKETQIHSHRGEANQSTSPQSAQVLLEQSLDYERLVEFTLISVRSFPSHQLIQGTSHLLLEAVPKEFQPPLSAATLPQECLALASEQVYVVQNTCGAVDFESNERTSFPNIVSVNEQCQWYF